MFCVNDNVRSVAYRKAGALLVPPFFFFGVALLNGHTTLQKALWESVKSECGVYTQVLQCSFAALKTRFLFFPRSHKAVFLLLPVLALPFSACFSRAHVWDFSQPWFFWPWRKCDVPLGTYLLICPFPCPHEVARRFWKTKLSLLFNVESFDLFSLQHFCHWLLPPPLYLGLLVCIKFCSLWSC